MRHAKARPRRRGLRVLLALASVITVIAAMLAAATRLDLDSEMLAWITEGSALGSAPRGSMPDSGPRRSPAPVATPDLASTRTPAVLSQTASPSPSPTPTTPRTPALRTPDINEPLPANSGQGKRIVYTLKTNHVWLVAADGTVKRDYLVSGTKYGQVEPGTYEVLRKRRDTTSYHGTETMEYMVTFTEGENAAIGFHDIPVSIETGEPLQTLDQLGRSLSDGCVRQAEPDARALWEFAPVGTTVVVLP